MICLFAILSLSYLPSSSLESRFEICEEIVDASIKKDVDPVLSVGIALEESRLSYVTSPRGAIGPMQILEKYWCKTQPQNCNPIEAGVRAISYFLKKYKGSEFNAVRSYAGRGARARRYAVRVLARVDRIREQVKIFDDLFSY